MLVMPNGLVVFPTFFYLSLNFAIKSWCNKEFLCNKEPQLAPGLFFFFFFFFCWLYRTNFSIFGSNNIINLILVLTIWLCPCVELSQVLLEEDGCQEGCPFSWQNSVKLCCASFCISRANLPVTQDNSWLPTFTFQFYDEMVN